MAEPRGSERFYVAEQLNCFKTQVRANPVICRWPPDEFDQDISDLAVYFDSTDAGKV